MLTLALCVDAAQDLSAEVDGIDGTLPSFATAYAVVAVECAAALKEADPLADVTLEVREVVCEWTAVEALGQACEALQLVFTVAAAWRARTATVAGIR